MTCDDDDDDDDSCCCSTSAVVPVDVMSTCSSVIPVIVVVVVVVVSMDDEEEVLIPVAAMRKSSNLKLPLSVISYSLLFDGTLSTGRAKGFLVLFFGFFKTAIGRFTAVDVDDDVDDDVIVSFVSFGMMFKVGVASVGELLCERLSL